MPKESSAGRGVFVFQAVRPRVLNIDKIGWRLLATSRMAQMLVLTWNSCGSDSVRRMAFVSLWCLWITTSVADDNARPTIVFEDVTSAAGMLDSLAGMMGHGAAWGDVNGTAGPIYLLAAFAIGRMPSTGPPRGRCRAGCF